MSESQAKALGRHLREAIRRTPQPTRRMFDLGMTPAEYGMFGEMAQRYFEMATGPFHLEIPGDTWLRRMYSRWRIMSAIEECQRGLKPQHECGPLMSDFYNADLGEPYELKQLEPDPLLRRKMIFGELHVPAEYASDEVLTEPKVILEFEIPKMTDAEELQFTYDRHQMNSRVPFERPIELKNGEEVSIQFEFEIKEPTRVHEPEGAAMFGYIPQPPSEPEIVCPCCKGSGTYTGFIKVEPCGECKGTGKVKGTAKPPEQAGAKGSPDIDYSALGLMSRQDREFS